MKKTLVFFLLSFSFFLNFIFFKCFSTYDLCSGMVGEHGEIAYNVWKSNSFLYNHQRACYIAELQKKLHRQVQYNEVDHTLFCSSLNYYKGIVHTPFYGGLLGLLWKITGSLKYEDIVYFQIILFSLCIVLVYYCFGILFKNDKITFLSTLMHLLFFPILYLNVHPLRDIWTYYGLVFLLSGFVIYMFSSSSFLILFIFSLLFAGCELIRPLLFATLIIFSLMMIFGSIFLKCIPFKKNIIALATFWACTIILFWLPFGSYNLSVHNRFFVSSSGQTLLEGLGEIDNKWGYKISDGWYYYYMKKNYSLQGNSIECDDKAKELFFNALKKEPIFYIKLLAYRLRNLILPGIVWFSYVPGFEGISLKEKIYRATHSWHALSDLFGRQVYIRLYLLLGYLGIIFLLIRRYYFLVLLIFCGIIASSWWMLFVHLEHRYLIPYYAFFSFFVGYALYELKKIIALLFKKKEEVVVG